jgi:hypothetical protein
MQRLALLLDFLSLILMGSGLLVSDPKPGNRKIATPNDELI